MRQRSGAMSVGGWVLGGGCEGGGLECWFWRDVMEGGGRDGRDGREGIAAENREHDRR